MTRKGHDPYRLFRYVALGAGEGIISGWIILILLKYQNILGIGTLIENSSQGGLALVMLLIFFGITFGMVGIAWRVMVLLPDEKS